jgi:hypothetical protein
MHGVAPHMCDRGASPLLDRGAGGRSPGFLFFGLRPVNLLSTACKFTAGADAVTLSELHAGHDDARPVQANPC